jgi:hypothetical protein
MKATLDILRSRFDYVVISTEFGMSTAFGTAVARRASPSSADRAVFAC